MAKQKTGTRLTMRDVSFLKPRRFHDHLTLTELARRVTKDPSWLLRLERADRIPVAARVKHGKLQVRLWSPAQVVEIERILSNMKVGRPKAQ